MSLNRISIILILGILLFLVIGVISRDVFAQVLPDSTISWFVMASGGGSGSVANITLESTVGQPFVGSSDAGNVSLGTGYWYAEETLELYLPIVIKR
jgi:hypothetical protein